MPSQEQTPEERMLIGCRHDLHARVILNRLAVQVISDAEGSTLLLHAALYLEDRLGYRANRLGLLTANLRAAEHFPMEAGDLIR